MRNGIIYKKKDKDGLLFNVPSEMESNVLFSYHDQLGHVGIDKVVEVISKSYRFPKVREKCKRHINNCLECIAYSDKSG